MSSPACRRMALVLAGASLFAACTSTTTDSAGRMPAAANVPIAIDPLVPGAVERGVPTPDQMIEAVGRLEAAGNRAAAERLTRHATSVVLAGLLRHDADGPSLRRVAANYDRATDSTAADGGMAALIESHLASPDALKDYDEARAALLESLRVGDAEAALAHCPLPVPVELPGAGALTIEACSLQGFAELTAGRSDLAQQSFEAGVKVAGTQRPFEAARLGLLQCRAQAAAQGSASAATWTQAVRTAAKLEDLVDPAFWEQAIALRPANTAWPAEVVALAEKIVAPDGGSSPDEVQAVLTGAMGLQLLEAEQPTPALLALIRAESLATQPRTQGTLKTAQARALIALGRPGDAIATLATLAENKDPYISRPALALAGALELKLSRPQRARELLTLALEGEDLSFAGRSEAQANLGLACLKLGERDEGLRNLHEAQARFEAEHDFEALSRSLRNELAYASEARMSDDAVRIQQRLDAVDRR